MVDNIDKLIRGSSRAQCGLAEREAMVKTKNIPSIAKGLRGRGYRVIGTGYKESPAKTRKIWFIKMGLGSL